MKELIKQKKYHFILITILICIAALSEAIVCFHYDELRKNPLVITRFLRIRPVYNDDGSWIHGKLGIGYIGWLLISEDIITILMAIYLFRFMEACNRFFGISQGWLYSLDFGIATTLYRLITEVRKVFTLDYLNIGRNTFDFPDFYLGVLMAGLIIWYFPVMGAYHKYKKNKIKGMCFKEKLIWEFKFSGMLLKIPVLNKKKWQETFDLWQSL